MSECPNCGAPANDNSDPKVGFIDYDCWSTNEGGEPSEACKIIAELRSKLRNMEQREDAQPHIVSRLHTAEALVREQRAEIAALKASEVSRERLQRAEAERDEWRKAYYLHQLLAMRMAKDADDAIERAEEAEAARDRLGALLLQANVRAEKAEAVIAVLRDGMVRTLRAMPGIELTEAYDE